RRARGGVEEADLANAAVLDDLLHAPPVGGVLELVADDCPHIPRAQVDDAPGLGERQRERLLERDGAHTVAHTELHEGKAHGRWSRETQHVGTLGGEHRARVRVGTRDAERAGERGDPLLLQVAHRGQLEAVRVRVTVKADVVRRDDGDVLRQGSWVAVLGTSDLTKGNAIALTPARGYAGG